MNNVPPLESLERRRLLSASAALDDGTLSISGTEAADAMYVTIRPVRAESPADGGRRFERKIVVRGVGDEPATYDPADVSAIRVDLGGGDDRLRVGRLRFAGDVSIDAGTGDDVVRFGRVRIGGEVDIDLGDGDDRLSMRRVALGGPTTIDGGAGEDRAVARRVRAADLTLDDVETTRGRAFA